MGRRADEDLPEVVVNQPSPRPHDQGAHAPEVVPDSSPEAAQQRYFMETDKYPAYYDNAPKFPYEEPTTPKPTPGMQSPGMQTPGQQYQQLWDGGEQPVSALSPNSSLPWQSFPHDDQATYVGSEPEQEKRICGIRKRLFAIIAIVLGVVIIAVAVGGGVGGSMAAKQANEAAASNTASASGSGSSETATGSRTATASSSTTSSAPKPTVTDLSNATDDAFKQPIQFQGWSEHNFKGRKTEVLTDEGFYDIGFNITSYVWINQKDGCCVTFCRDENTYAGGFRCDSWKRPAVDDKWGLPRINLWCGDRNSEKSQQKCK